MPLKLKNPFKRKKKKTKAPSGDAPAAPGDDTDSAPAAAAESSGSKSGSNAEFIDEALSAHNRYRSKHGAPPLKHNKELSKIAQEWADHLAKTGQFKHSTNKYKGNNLGENIASKMSSSGADYTGQAVTDQWYSEEKDFDYGNQESMGKSGHFTQVVWKGSKMAGLGKASKNGKFFVVANYYPAGHFTQVVWKGSQDFGIGKAFSGNKCFVCANYYPAGNMMRSFKDNVGRPH